MKALICTGASSLEFRDVTGPRPGPDDVLVRIAACGICGTDLHVYHSHDSGDTPQILGHEAAGTVMAGRHTGMRVAINPLIIPPDCPSIDAGRPHLSPRRQIISMEQRPGAFAEWIAVPERNLVEIPETMSFDEAALSEPLAVCWHAVKRGLLLVGDDPRNIRVAVLGGGAIGLGSALVLRLFGVGHIAIGETNALRRDTARRAGDFRAYMPGSSEEPAPASIDLVIDAVGAVASRASASEIVRPGGVIIHAGLLSGSEGLDIRRITLQEIMFAGTCCYTPQDFKATVDALAAGRFGPLDWVEYRRLEDGARAFSDLDAGHVRAAKIVLRI